MARYSGNVGFIENVKTGPGKWTPQTTEHHYYGDVTRAVRKIVDGQDVNHNVVIDNVISIVADPYARKHYFAIRYAWYQGAKWEVSSVEVLYPRLILTLGGLYNGDT